MAYYEVLILLIPTVLVIFALYFMFRQFFQSQLRTQAMKLKQEESKTTLRLKLNAYERLMLFCERISIQSLLLRIQSPEMTAKDLRAALILAIQQEHEHNLSQQLYVSDKLWKIIQLAKDQLIEIITHVSTKVPDNGHAQDFSKQLILFVESQKTNPIETAKSAIRKEASLHL